jgi:hypothetical protein
MKWLWIAGLALVSCGRKAPGDEPPVRPPPADAATATATDVTAEPAAPGTPDLAHCERLPFAATLPVPEASGAVWLSRDGGVVMVIGDSGHDGAYVIVDDEDGRVLERGKLPLGGPGDDLEGLATEGPDGEMLWAITSSGFVRGWQHKDGSGFRLAVAAQRIDEDDDCAVDSFNCGRNYEGLCLAPAGVTSGGCAGYAVAKADGDLVCLVRDGEHWRADRARNIDLGTRDAAAACDITADGTVWTGDNLFGGTVVRRVAGGKIVGSAPLGEGFPEAMAIGPGGIVFRFSDVGGSSPSRAAKYRCARPPG